MEYGNGNAWAAERSTDPGQTAEVFGSRSWKLLQVVCSVLLRFNGERSLDGYSAPDGSCMEGRMERSLEMSARDRILLVGANTMPAK